MTRMSNHQKHNKNLLNTERREDDALRGTIDITLDINNLAHSAYHLARLLSSLPGKGEMIAINAPWGGGKTSLVNLTRPLLNTSEHESTINEDNVKQKYTPPQYDMDAFNCDLKEWHKTPPIFVDFNAWLQQGSEGKIALAIFDEIINAAKQRKSIEKFVLATKRYIRRNSSTNISNVVSFLTQGTVTTETSGPKIHKELESLQQNLKETKQKVIVVIDDIDRMPPNHLQNLIMALWGIRELVNITFLLLYDHEQVIKGLAGTLFNTHKSDDAITRATRFMEKIIQYSFNVPQPTLTTLLETLESRLQEIDSNIFKFPGTPSKGHYLKELRWDAIKRLVLLELLDTLRSVNRLVFSVKATWTMRNYIPIDYRDLILVEAIRLFRPELLYDIQQFNMKINQGIIDLEELPIHPTTSQYVLSLLFPNHFKLKGEKPIEDIQNVKKRYGFGDPDLTLHYLSGMTNQTVNVVYNIQAFRTGNDGIFIPNLIQATKDGRLIELITFIQSKIIRAAEDHDKKACITERLTRVLDGAKNQCKDSDIKSKITDTINTLKV